MATGGHSICHAKCLATAASRIRLRLLIICASAHQRWGSLLNPSSLNFSTPACDTVGYGSESLCIGNYGGRLWLQEMVQGILWWHPAAGSIGAVSEFQINIASDHIVEPILSYLLKDL